MFKSISGKLTKLNNNIPLINRALTSNIFNIEKLKINNTTENIIKGEQNMNLKLKTEDETDIINKFTNHKIHTAIETLYKFKV